MISWGADIHARDNRNYTPLHLAIRHAPDNINAAEQVIAHLVSAGATAKVKDDHGRSPLDYILDYENAEDARRIEAVLKRLGIRRDFMPHFHRIS